MSEPIYGKWFSVEEFTPPERPSEWFVTAIQRKEGDISDGETVTYTVIRAHYPDSQFPKDAKAWMRIQPPPWLDPKGPHAAASAESAAAASKYAGWKP